MTRQIALLRGINVGGHKKVPMAQLRELLSGHGYEDVRTYVQSGNVVLSGPDVPAAEAERRLEREIEDEFGFPVSVLVRTGEQWRAVVAANPFVEVADDPSRQFVLFLSEPLADERRDAIDPDGFGPDRVVLGEREIHVWAPGGALESAALKGLAQQKLGVTITARNWRTVEKLLALAEAE